MAEEQPQSDHVFCYKCGADLGIKAGEQVGRRDSCDKCRFDIRVCRNCKHYDQKAYNECREPMADRVVDKEKSNFCDYFSTKAGPPGGVKDEAAEAKRRLDALFK